MTTFVDGAATFAPVQAPLRDWLREQMATDVGIDANGITQVYVGSFPDAIDLTGGRLEVYDKDGKTIDRWVVRFAYPRNGNVFNPTPTYMWTVSSNGQIYANFSKLRDAKKAVQGGEE